MIALLTLVISITALMATSAASLARPTVRPILEGSSAAAHPRVAHGGALVDVVERASRDARSGVALRPALLAALQHHPQLMSTLRERLMRGAPMIEALDDHTDAVTVVHHDDTQFVLQGLRVAADTGGAVADTLDRVVMVVRERQAWRAERYAQSAQARLSARMLTALPMAVAAWGLLSGPRVRQAYVDTPATSVLTAMGIALNATGWWWMRRLVAGRPHP